MRTSNTEKSRKEAESLIYLIIGSMILIFLIASFFVSVTVESGTNYIVNSKFLYVLSFYNPFILGIYVLIGVVFLFLGLKSIRKK